MNCNVCTATANEITVQRQVCMKLIFFNYFLLFSCMLMSSIMFQYQQKFAQGSGSLNRNNNVCATTNSKHGEQQDVIYTLLYELWFFMFILFYIFFMFIEQYQNSAEKLVTKPNTSNMCATTKQVRKWHTNSLFLLFQYWT